MTERETHGKNDELYLINSLADSALKASNFFAEANFELKLGSVKDTHELHGEFDVCCGDDRYSAHGGNNLNFMRKACRASIIGGLYLVMAEVTGGSAGGVASAQKHAANMGITLVRHGDDHKNDYGCKMFEMWAKKELDTQ